MAMGRWRGERQGTLFIETEKLARSEGRLLHADAMAYDLIARTKPRAARTALS